MGAAMGAAWASRNSKRLTDEADADTEDPRQSACVTLAEHDAALFEVLTNTADNAEEGEAVAAIDAELLLARAGVAEKMLKVHLTGHVTVVVSPTGDVVVQKGHR